MSAIATWLDDFRVLYSKARQRQLSPTELPDFVAARDKFMAAILAAQQIEAPQGQPLRRAVRVSRSVPVDVELDGAIEHAHTLQVSTGGFAAVLAHSPRVNDRLQVALRLPRGVLRCRARVVDVRDGTGATRVGFELLNLRAEDTESLEFFVLDVILGHVGR